MGCYLTNLQAAWSLSTVWWTKGGGAEEILSVLMHGGLVCL